MKTASARYRKLNEILGEGSFKTVAKAIDEEEGKEVAYNEVRIKQYEEETQTSSSFSKEIALLKNIDHPYIIKIFDYWFIEENFVFITELMTGGTLRDYITKVGPLNSRLIKKWGRQVLEGLRYLHTQDPPIIHRDIKNENIFVNSSQGEIKIGDLGIAKEKKHKRYTIVGTPNFMAREMFEGEGYSEKVDVYAFGMSLIEMATGKTPYSELPDSSDVYRNVLRGVLPGSLCLVQDGCLRSLIMGCLVPDANRYSAAQCLEHHFFQAENSCTGDCLPKECVTVFPLSESVPGMELSLISFNGNVITFQIHLTDTSRFIKFDYDRDTDTLQKVASELIAENIIESSSIDAFIDLLDRGIKKAVNRKDSEEIMDEAPESRVEEKVHIHAPRNNDAPNISPKVALQPSDFQQIKKIEFGEKTLEVMKDIEEEMLYMEQKKATEKKKEEEAPRKIRNEHISTKLETRPCDTNGPSTCATTIQTQLHCSNGSLINSPTASCNNSSIISNPTTLETPSEGIELSSLMIDKRISRVDSPASPPNTIRDSTLASPQSLRNGLNEQVPDELSLSEGYEISKSKYKTNCSVSQFAYDAAAITSRSEDTAKSWIKALREDNIETVFDLKLIVYEDWEKLLLTVFSVRIMQNMLYGLDNIPLREKQLPMNPDMKDYDNNLSIKEFLVDVCGLIERPELASSWENKLMAQDVRTVAELKSLHQDDWARLGLSVFAHRILKNVIFRKGRINLE